jgi:hypothetical protein
MGLLDTTLKETKCTITKPYRLLVLISWQPWLRAVFVELCHRQIYGQSALYEPFAE